VPERQLFTISQAAFALGLSESALRMRLRRRTFRGVVCDEFGQLRIPAEAINAYIRHLKARPVAEMHELARPTAN
jgi:hypothetical protein